MKLSKVTGHLGAIAKMWRYGKPEMNLVTCKHSPAGIAACALAALASASLFVPVSSLAQSEGGAVTPLPGATIPEFHSEAPPISLVRSDGEYLLVVSGGTRRQVVEKLFSEVGVAWSWRDDTYGSEPIEGRYIGTVDEIVFRLLFGTSFVAVYDMSAVSPLISSVTVHGPDPDEPGSKRAQTVSTTAETDELSANTAGVQVRYQEPNASDDNRTPPGAPKVVGVSKLEDLRINSQE